MTVREYFSPQTGLLVQIDKPDDEWAEIDAQQRLVNEAISPKMTDGSFAQTPPNYVDAFNNTETLLISDDPAPRIAPTVGSSSYETSRETAWGLEGYSQQFHY